MNLEPAAVKKDAERLFGQNWRPFHSQEPQAPYIRTDQALVGLNGSANFLPSEEASKPGRGWSGSCL